MNNAIDYLEEIEEEINLSVQPHRLTEAEATLIEQYIKRLKRNARRRQLYAQKKEKIAA